MERNESPDFEEKEEKDQYILEVSNGLGQIVRIHRQQANLTQEKLAESVGISTRSLQNIEAGKTSIDFYNYLLLATRLNLHQAIQSSEELTRAATTFLDRFNLDDE